MGAVFLIVALALSLYGVGVIIGKVGALRIIQSDLNQVMNTNSLKGKTDNGV